ncbi:MAG: sialidase family protein [Bryobacteraceae bacterium]
MAKLLIILMAPLILLAEPARLDLGDASGWQFVNGAWKQDGDVVKPPTERADFYYAFRRGASHSDLTAEFDFRITTNHADAGLIIRAQDPAHFYMVHFPNGGQQYRAQHFWAALSVSDGTGYLRFLKLALVPRVPSNLGLWKKVKIQVSGDEFRLFVNGFEAFTVRDRTFLQPGRIGLAGFARFELRNLRIDGKALPEQAWNEGVKFPKTWFIPAAAPQLGWQHRPSLTMTRNGTMLMLMNTTKGKSMVDPREAGNATVLLRSTDKGRTWSKPEIRAELTGCELLTLKDGSLIAIKTGTPPHETTQPTTNEIWRLESSDDGRTWSKPEKARWDGPFPKDPKTLGGAYTVQLKDGAIVLFLIGGHSSTQKGLNVTTWGSIHTSAFSTRSTDGGRTWSPPVNLDANPPWPPNSPQYEGNLDLTEAVGAETSDGRIISLTRPIYSPWMWESWSEDGGKTWGPSVRGPFPGYAPLPMIRTASGAMMIATRFPGITIHSSYDDGKTWDEGTYLDSSIWAMGDMVEVEPNLVFLAYMDSFGGPVRAQFIRVGPKGLVPDTAWIPKQ